MFITRYAIGAAKKSEEQVPYTTPRIMAKAKLRMLSPPTKKMKSRLAQKTQQATARKKRKLTALIMTDRNSFPILNPFPLLKKKRTRLNLINTIRKSHVK